MKNSNTGTHTSSKAKAVSDCCKAEAGMQNQAHAGGMQSKAKTGNDKGGSSTKKGGGGTKSGGTKNCAR